jgi:putative FmdB family regulatory protein
MPIYEYRCKKGHRFEVIQRMSDDPVTACETCGATVEKVMHSPAIHFKGSGFYSTDYGSRKRSRELKDAAEGKSKNEKSSDSSSSDSKSDSKSDSSKSDSGKSESKPAQSNAA